MSWEMFLSIVLLFALSLSMVSSVGASSRWSQTYGGANAEAPISLVQTRDGGYALVGFTQSFAIGGENAAWLVKTDEYGYMEWNRTYGTSGAETNPYGLVQTSDGGFAIAGQTFPSHDSICDCWLVKTDSYGNMEWNKTYGEIRMDYFTSLVCTADGGFALAGAKGFNSANGDDFWLIKTNEYGTIPEFPSWTILTLLTTVTVLAMIATKRKTKA